MRIQLRIAAWKHQTHFDFPEHVVDQMLNYGYDKGVDMLFCDHTILLSPGGSVNLIEGLSYHANRDWPVGCDFKTSDVWTGTYFPVTGFEAHLGPRGNIIVELPPIHELPWPSCSAKLSDAEWIELMANRIVSANRAGVPIGAPSHLIGMRQVFKAGWVKSREKEAA